MYILEFLQLLINYQLKQQITVRYIIYLYNLLSTEYIIMLVILCMLRNYKRLKVHNIEVKIRIDTGLTLDIVT